MKNLTIIYQNSVDFWEWQINWKSLHFFHELLKKKMPECGMHYNMLLPLLGSKEEGFCQCVVANFGVEFFTQLFQAFEDFTKLLNDVSFGTMYCLDGEES